MDASAAGFDPAPGSTQEEQALGTLFEAHSQLAEALKQHDDLERLAVDDAEMREVRERSKKEIRMDRSVSGSTSTSLTRSRGHTTRAATFWHLAQTLALHLDLHRLHPMPALQLRCHHLGEETSLYRCRDLFLQWKTGQERLLRTDSFPRSRSHLHEPHLPLVIMRPKHGCLGHCRIPSIVVIRLPHKACPVPSMPLWMLLVRVQPMLATMRRPKLMWITRTRMHRFP